MKRASGILVFALALGFGAGALEVGLRAAPRLGLGPQAVAAWLAWGVGLSLAWTAAAALAARLVGKRVHGLVLAAVIVVPAALWWRFDRHLNEFFGDPVVWGGLLGIALGSLAVGLALDRFLARRVRALTRLALAVGVAGAILAFARARPPLHPAAEPATGRPSVLLVTLDTTRADRLGAYGGRAHTPVFDRIAREGVLFEQAIATAPLTEASHLALLTGEPPHRSGVVSNGTRIGDRPLMVSEVLRRRGWLTAGFVSGFPLHGRYGWAEHFDVYDDDFGTVPGLHRLSLVKAWDQVAQRAHALRERRGDRTVDRALAWLDRQERAAPDQPFFLWLHLFDAHAPYEAPGHPFDPPTDGEPLDLPAYWPPRDRAITSTEWLTRAYEAEIAYADAQLGRLVAALEARGLLDDMLVVVTADHGESLTEHGYLFDHGDHLYDASLRVPLAVRWPGRVAAGARLGCQVSNLDVAPTILGLLGVDDGQARTGLDRAADLRAGTCADEPVVSTTVAGRFVAHPPVDHALRHDDHKLIRHALAEERGVPAEECYDLAADPAETRDLGACPPSLGAEFDRLLRGAGEAASPEMDAGTRDALKALGYIE